MKILFPCAPARFIRHSSFVLCAAAAALPCGCRKPAAPAPEAARLETRLSLIESNVTELYSRNENRIMNISNLWNAQESILSLMKSNNDDLQTLEFVVEQRGAAAAIPARSAVPVPTASQPPAWVLQQIRSKAAQEWPGDYTMQAWEIKNQVESWHKLNP